MEGQKRNFGGNTYIFFFFLKHLYFNDPKKAKDSGK